MPSLLGFLPDKFKQRRVQNLLDKAFYYMALKQYTSARRAASRIRWFDQQHIQAQTIQGECWFLEKSLTHALICVDKALLLDPLDNDALLIKGNIRLDQKQYDSAIHHFQMILKNPENKTQLAAVYNNLGFCKNLTGSFPEAIADFDKAIALNKTLAYAYNNRGFARMKLGDFKLAEDDINTSLGLDSLNSYAYKNRGLLHIETGQRDLACQDFFKALRLGYTETYNTDVEDLIEKYGCNI